MFESHQERVIVCLWLAFSKDPVRPWWWVKVKVKSEVAQSCPTLCDPTDCSLAGFSIHGFFQARILEWVAISVKHCYLLRCPAQDRKILAVLLPWKRALFPAWLSWFCLSKSADQLVKQWSQDIQPGVQLLGYVAPVSLDNVRPHFQEGPQGLLGARLLLGILHSHLMKQHLWEAVVGKVEAGLRFSKHGASQLTNHHSYPFSKDLGKCWHPIHSTDEATKDSAGEMIHPSSRGF